MVKFSVLLPTRNRLDLLKYAVETVVRQDYDNWEIIIYDNCSEEDVRGFAESLDDPRVKYFSTDSFVPVTDNWNNALEKSSGDYVIMLGDDDCLMQHYFKSLNELISEHSNPDLVYTNAFLYAYPGVIPESPDGFLSVWDYTVFREKNPYLLSKEKARELVGKTFDFIVGFGWNMQFSLVSRNLINKIKSEGAFYQSPYPDYYTTNLIFLAAEKILVVPYPMVTVGISPKSFGAYYFSGREDQGIDFLKNTVPAGYQNLSDVVLPGEQHNTNWLFSVETVKKNFGTFLGGIDVNYEKYRRLQIFYLYKRYYIDKKASKSQVRSLEKFLRPEEKKYALKLRIKFNLMKLGILKEGREIDRIINEFGQYPKDTTRLLRSKDNYKNILEVFENESDKHNPGAAKNG
ncbi:MAG: glycosyltransferase [Chloroflexi bacterium]|nr:glycosyltransferase [Chloroflexota bacterium]